MMTASRVVLLVSISLLSGCATMPVAPSVLALPGTGTSLEQFYTDDTACRQWALQRTQETAQGAPADQAYGAGVPQRWYDMAYLQCMYAKGNRIPWVQTGSPLPPPPPPTASPPSSSSPPAGAEPPPAPAP